MTIQVSRPMRASIYVCIAGMLYLGLFPNCTVELAAPQVVGIEPDHEAWVVGDEPGLGSYLSAEVRDVADRVLRATVLREDR